VNVGRHILDSLTYVSDAVVAASSTPAKVASSWVTDRLAPSYWVPNSELTVSAVLLVLLLIMLLTELTISAVLLVLLLIMLLTVVHLTNYSRPTCDTCFVRPPEYSNTKKAT